MKKPLLICQGKSSSFSKPRLLHYIENTGDTDLVFLEMFKSNRYQEFSFSEWLAHTPSKLVMAHLNIDKATYDAMPKNGVAISQCN